VTETSIIVGVDGGGTKTRIVAADPSGHILASVSGGPSAIGKNNIDAAADTIAALLRDALDGVGLHGVVPAAMCAGVAGAGRDVPRKALQRALRSREVADEVLVTTDAQVALADAFGDGPGVLLIAGTGSIAFGRSPTDELDRCGGWGTSIGDEGSAHWLVRRALSAATASADGREPQTGLLGALITATQCDEPDDLIEWIAKAELTDIAALAPVVLRTAENGDQRAHTLVSLAAEELVLHVRTLARRLFGDERAAVPVAMSGGLLQRGGIMRKLVEHRFKSAVPGAVVHHDDVDPARGALRLARRGSPAGGD
jgi:glucosamine kinase